MLLLQIQFFGGDPRTATGNVNQYLFKNLFQLIKPLDVVANKNIQWNLYLLIFQVLSDDDISTSQYYKPADD